MIDFLRRHASWGRLMNHLQKDVKFWLVAFGFLWAFRWVMIVIFRGESMEPLTVADLTLCSINGARFDGRVASFWLLPCLTVSLGTFAFDYGRWADRFRLLVATVYFVYTSLLCVITVGFFQEYHDQFNQWIFGTIYDDQVAIAKTIWAEYPIIWIVLGFCAWLAAGWWGLRRWLRTPFIAGDRLAQRIPGRTLRVVIVLLIILLAWVGTRGSLSWRRMRIRDASITRNVFLNKLVLNPQNALEYTIRNFRRVSSAAGLKTILPDGDIVAAAKRQFPGAAEYRNLDDLMRRQARGPIGPPPRHVFLLVIESYDAWAMLPQYRSFGLTERLKELTRRGILVDAFVSSGVATVESLSALVTGLPDVGVFPNYHPATRVPMPCAMAPTFRRLGYRTRFFYSGFLSWQRFDQFLPNQGFEEMHGASHVTKWTWPTDWGVPDHYLFDYIQETVKDDVPSLNLVLTTANHPPFRQDVHKMGFPHLEIPADLKHLYDGKVSLRAFGHLWYSDRCVNDFVQAMEKKLPGSLFVITGDHHSRRFLNGRPTLYERSAVPLVFYGPKVLAGFTPPDRVAGSHLDITPTLVEMFAPAGFEYQTLGRNIFDPSLPALGFGTKRVIGPGFILDASSTAAPEPIPGRPLPPLPAPAEELRRQFATLHGLGWWRIMKGSSLLDPPESGIGRGSQEK